MASITPSFTDNVSVIAAADLARGSIARGTLDLLAKWGAWLMVRLGREGTTALDVSAKVVIRRLINGVAIRHPAAAILESQVAAAQSTTVNVDSNSGQNVLQVASVASFAAADLIVIGAGTAREEWARVSKISGSTLVLDSNLLSTHTAAQADTVRNKADVFAAIWVEGGAQYEVVVDYGAATTGESLRVEVLAQRFDSVQSA